MPTNLLSYAQALGSTAIISAADFAYQLLPGEAAYVLKDRQGECGVVLSHDELVEAVRGYSSVLITGPVDESGHFELATLKDEEGKIAAAREEHTVQGTVHNPNSIV